MSLCWGTLYSVIFHLVVIYSGINKTIKRKGLMILFYLSVYIPAAYNIYLYFLSPYPPESLVLTDKGWIISDYFVESFMWNNFFYIYYLVFMISSIFILFRWYLRAEKRIEKKQSMLLFLAFLSTLLIGSILEIILPLLGFQIIYGITIFIALIPITSIWYAIEHYNLMDFDPKKLTGEMLKLMSDGLILVGDEGHIELLNQGASSILGYGSHEELNISEICGEEIANNLSSKAMTFRRNNGQDIDVLVSTLPIVDRLNDAYGKVIMFQDIHNLKATQKELKKLNDDLEALVQERTYSLQESNADLVKEIAMRKKAEEHIRYLAYHDYLTKLPNLRLFKKALIDKIDDYKQTEQRVATVFIDLDEFKTINDTLGHNIGDELLIEIGNRLGDFAEGEMAVTRNGGDEFLILLTEHRPFEEQVKELAGLFTEPFEVNNNLLNINCSIGIAIYPDHGLDYEALIQAADIAMYESKKSHATRYKFYNQTMVEGLSEELELSNDLHDAIHNKELEVYYQPIVDARSRSIIGSEALIRWNHPSKGMISPLKFIHIAEKTGLIDQITEFVIDEVVKVLKQLQLVKEDKFKISVNISAHQLIHEGIMTDFLMVSEKYGDLLSHIEFEVTENAFINNKEMAIEVLNAVRDKGISIAIDDFGVNYSSLNYIKQLPISKLKIDKIFIDGIQQNAKDEGIILTIIALAQNLELELVAEGVEHEEQVEFLLKQACYSIQGYHYYKPMSEDDFLKLLL